MLEAAGTPKKTGSTAKDSTDWRTAELYLERRGERSIVGNVYKAKVENVVAGLEAAFVDIGYEKNGFLHVDDIVVNGKQVAKRGTGKGARITDLLKSGQEVVVQVTKDPLKTKGARLTMQLAIPGRYMVYVPTGEGVGFSRRLEDKERVRLRREARDLDLGGGGTIIRTAARGAKKKDFERELLYLHMLTDVLERRAKEATAPSMIFQEADLSIRVIRDVFSDELDEVLIDDDAQFDRVKSFLIRTAPELADRVVRYDGKGPLFEHFGVDKEIQKILSRRVDLPSGGYLVIDHTEALTIIDVNTGSFTGRGKARGLEETITHTNLEAADEAVRQIRLRDIGGIIVIDFIDMARAANRDAVLKVMRKALDEDRTKTHVVEISPLGLVEMTRQNVTDGVREIMTKRCPVCDGEGVVLSEDTVALHVERHLRAHIADNPKPEAYLAQVNPRVSAALLHGSGDPIGALERETGKEIHFEGGDGLPLEHFEVSYEGTKQKVQERALPFQIGDEVMVHVVEPHMYEDDAAVAKLGHYIIAITDALDRIGTKALVRIEEVDRHVARAVIADDGPPAGSKKPARSGSSRAKSAPSGGGSSNGGGGSRTAVKAVVGADSSDSDDDAVESSTSRAPRRRGSRGGRGRSRPRSAGSDGSAGPLSSDGSSSTADDAPRSDSSSTESTE
ncbi:MAG: Rne/Rng family ribonuclease [Solirubrobacterales bacterium]